ncbi:unnamed protein product [Absidia cylindrospora]
MTSTPSTKQLLDDILLEPYHYLLTHPGKDIRSKLIKAFGLWLKVPSDALQIITKVIEMLHNASLMIDDVQDGSDLRRSVPVAHHIYGVPQTINCANYVYFLALQHILQLTILSWLLSTLKNWSIYIKDRALNCSGGIL